MTLSPQTGQRSRSDRCTRPWRSRRSITWLRIEARTARARPACSAEVNRACCVLSRSITASESLTISSFPLWGELYRADGTFPRGRNGHLHHHGFARAHPRWHPSAMDKSFFATFEDRKKEFAGRAGEGEDVKAELVLGNGRIYQVDRIVETT